MDEQQKHLLDRIKKLTAALYRVTDLMSDKEPLKWSLRNKALNIYEKLMRLASPVLKASDRNMFYDEARSSISEIGDMFDLVSMGGYVAGLNLDVLKKEYKNTGSVVEGEKDNFFKSKEPVLLEMPEFIEKESIKTVTLSTLKETPTQRDVHKGQKEMSVIKDKEVSNRKIGNRKDKILIYLKDKGEKTAGEISSIFSGISGKSIQRDLFDLIHEGKIVGKGEKRWRKYSLMENIVF